MQPSFEVDLDPQLKSTNVLRRYIDLPKFVDLLRTRSLYFLRADRFSDRFEGALTPTMRRLLDEPVEVRDREIEDAETFYRHSREGAFVSCWSLGAHDNMALWQLYGGVTCSVAITTTVERLEIAAQTWSDNTYITKVKYIDHHKDAAMSLGHYTDLLAYKHRAYSFENEVRVIVSRHRGDWQKNPMELRLPVLDIDALIRSVVVAPEAGDWFFGLVEEITRRFEVSAPVRRSMLTALPR